MNIGFIGLGLMGRPMAHHLAQAGHILHLWARREASLQPFATTSAVIHDCPAGVAQHADVVITMVSDSPDVEAVCLGEHGVIAGAKAGSCVIDMSTIAPDAARQIGIRLAEQGIRFLDAPVSGGEIGAINATLTIMVGGAYEVFEQVKPVLSCMGKTITWIGECGAGQVAKACNQILGGVTVVAVAEALNFARQSGVDPARVREALLGGAAYSRILENHGQRMLERNFSPGFKAWMQQKDLRIVMNEAHRLGLMLPATAAAAQVFNALVGVGLGEADTVAILQLLEQIGSGDPRKNNRAAKEI
ncbi:6-phosphogluconate dehydrogenase [Rugosibacter aromaticivorans]|uniref:6-phosphogluconate dehydrogenase n=1 Tax=Rugosibacter aromaticivorans TaxID=1565605 RepID=A0A0C5JL83_9PROT|nr:NAD(P)-dependent oxidoreductase [Rugosibacter aromaticivorans]AJP48106.1 6-phosphogluconate dehydrogenase [Rugosibacter aromaticivorans]TBR15958.1 MAG: NAD(P)-dependent oxidoreductase [Rugosibacter sp.]